MRKLLILAALVFSAGIAQADNIEKTYLPDNHWAYSSLQQFERWGFADKNAITKPLKREDVATIIMRSDNARANFGWKKPANFDSRSANDIILALRREFADELARLAPSSNTGENTLESRVAAPPRLNIAPELLARIGYKSYIAKQAEEKPETAKKEAEKTEVPPK